MLKSMFIILLFIVTWAYPSPDPAESDSASVDTLNRPLPFHDGEKLTFRLRYGFITAGKAVMEVHKTQFRDSIPVYRFRTSARSASGFDWIYKVRDEVNSYVVPDGFYPLRFEKKLREGNYKADLLTDYLPRDSLARVEETRYHNNMRVRSRKKYEVTVPPYAQDVLSSFYYVRLLSLEPGKSQYLVNHEKKKVYNLRVVVHKRETIEVEAGTFRCIVVEPMIEGEGLFKKKGSLKIWLTDDRLRLPVQMTSKIIVGHITSELIKIEGVPLPVPARVK